jgi:hypothetical protein
LEDTDLKIGARSFRRRSILLAAAGILALVLTACTGRGGGQLPPQAGFTGPASFGFTFSCEDQGGINRQTGQLRIQLSYTDHGTSLLGSSFSIHGIVDTIDPILESETCIGDNPPPPSEFGNELIFLGRYYLTSSAPAHFPGSCPTRETTTTPLCRFEVIVRDNDEDFAPSPGDYFSIKLSNVTAVTTDCPPTVEPPCFITEFPDDPTTVPYARAGFLSSGNLTVD